MADQVQSWEQGMTCPYRSSWHKLFDKGLETVTHAQFDHKNILLFLRTGVLDLTNRIQNFCIFT